MKRGISLVNANATKVVLKVTTAWEEISVHEDPGLSETVVVIFQNPVAHAVRQWEESQGTVEIVSKPAILDAFALAWIKSRGLGKKTKEKPAKKSPPLRTKPYAKPAALRKKK